MNVVWTFALMVACGGICMARGQTPTNTAATPTNASSASSANPVPPPATAPKRSATEIQKLVEPIALHPDPLIAMILPAAAYPLEIVQATRFVKDTNNLSKLDD